MVKYAPDAPLPGKRVKAVSGDLGPTTRPRDISAKAADAKKKAQQSRNALIAKGKRGKQGDSDVGILGRHKLEAPVPAGRKTKLVKERVLQIEGRVKAAAAEKIRVKKAQLELAQRVRAEALQKPQKAQFDQTSLVGRNELAADVVAKRQVDSALEAGIIEKGQQKAAAAEISAKLQEDGAAVQAKVADDINKAMGILQKPVNTLDEVFGAAGPGKEAGVSSALGDIFAILDPPPPPPRQKYNAAPEPTNAADVTAAKAATASAQPPITTGAIRPPETRPNPTVRKKAFVATPVGADISAPRQREPPPAPRAPADVPKAAGQDKIGNNGAPEIPKVDEVRPARDGPPKDSSNPKNLVNPGEIDLGRLGGRRPVGTAPAPPRVNRIVNRVKGPGGAAPPPKARGPPDLLPRVGESTPGGGTNISARRLPVGDSSTGKPKKQQLQADQNPLSRGAPNDGPRMARRAAPTDTRIPVEVGKVTKPVNHDAGSKNALARDAKPPPVAKPEPPPVKKPDFTEPIPDFPGSEKLGVKQKPPKAGEDPTNPKRKRADEEGSTARDNIPEDGAKLKKQKGTPEEGVRKKEHDPAEVDKDPQKRAKDREAAEADAAKKKKDAEDEFNKKQKKEEKPNTPEEEAAARRRQAEEDARRARQKKVDDDEAELTKRKGLRLKRAANNGDKPGDANRKADTDNKNKVREDDNKITAERHGKDKLTLTQRVLKRVAEIGTNFLPLLFTSVGVASLAQLLLKMKNRSQTNAMLKTLTNNGKGITDKLSNELTSSIPDLQSGAMDGLTRGLADGARDGASDAAIAAGRYFVAANAGGPEEKAGKADGQARGEEDAATDTADISDDVIMRIRGFYDGQISGMRNARYDAQFDVKHLIPVSS